MRGLVLALMLFPLPAMAANPIPPLGKLEARAHPANCEQKTIPLSYPMKLICERPELRSRELQVYSAFGNVETLYQGQDRLIFVAGQIYWRGVIEGCQDNDGHPTNGHTSDETVRCIKDRMDRRLAFLDKLKANPAGLQSTVADYDYAEPWYLDLFPRQFEGKTLRVGGVLLQDSPICKELRAKPRDPAWSPDTLRDPVMSPKGRLQNWPGHDFWNVEFKAVTQTVNYACTAHPYAGEWDGVVKLDEKGRPYLYISG